ncbi:hypothetical protein V8C37DRAFT_84327 [Trichoderma ceciliae]
MIYAFIYLLSIIFLNAFVTSIYAAGCSCKTMVGKKNSSSRPSSQMSFIDANAFPPGHVLCINPSILSPCPFRQLISNLLVTYHSWSRIFLSLLSVLWGVFFFHVLVLLFHKFHPSKPYVHTCNTNQSFRNAIPT